MYPTNLFLFITFFASMSLIQSFITIFLDQEFTNFSVKGQIVFYILQAIQSVTIIHLCHCS